VTNGSGSVELYFPPNAFTAGAREVSIVPVTDVPAGKPVAMAQDLTLVGSAYRVDAGDASLRKPVTLQLGYTETELGSLEAALLGIFRLAGGEWERVGGTPDPVARKVATTTETLGTFALFEDRSTPVGSLAVVDVDCQPRAFAPAGGALRGETDISFQLTRSADVTVRVYNASGRLERVVAREVAMARGRNTVTWDGTDEEAEAVASGLYIVVVSAGSAQGEKVVAVVR
jgi:hypothetical protein